MDLSKLDIEQLKELKKALCEMEMEDDKQEEKPAKPEAGEGPGYGKPSSCGKIDIESSLVFIKICCH